MITERVGISQIHLLPFDLEGVGRANLLKLAILKSEFVKEHPTVTFDSAGLKKPESGRTTIHDNVIQVGIKRYNEDISSWPVTLIKPSMVTSRTIAVCLCEPEYIYPYILKQTFDVLLAHISDPFGSNLKENLENTATQIAYINWLLFLALGQRFDEIGTSRDKEGNVIPRNLSYFEPRGAGGNYDYDRYAYHARVKGRFH